MREFRVVTGPPGAGKSTYVDAHMAPGDVVIDYERLARALGSPVTERGPSGEWEHPEHMRWIVWATWRAAREEARRMRGYTVWLIQCYPSRTDLFTYQYSGATVINVDPGTHQPEVTP